MICVGIVIVEVCNGNAMMSLDVETILEEEFPEVSVLIHDCLSFCGLCRVRPYAIVNNKRIFADTPEQCLVKIRQEIKKELAKYE